MNREGNEWESGFPILVVWPGGKKSASFFCIKLFIPFFDTPFPYTITSAYLAALDVPQALQHQDKM